MQFSTAYSIVLTLGALTSGAFAACQPRTALCSGTFGTRCQSGNNDDGSPIFVCCDNSECNA
ncbi:hypothetical protein LX36DRAFT_657214 [Colletotrichum falcatum]|nr:hypothetical protein LX36DRAFT_657214 [Colletotrichum falcatum]